MEKKGLVEENVLLRGDSLASQIVFWLTTLVVCWCLWLGDVGHVPCGVQPHLRSPEEDLVLGGQAELLDEVGMLHQEGDLAADMDAALRGPPCRRHRPRQA